LDDLAKHGILYLISSRLIPFVISRQDEIIG